MKLNFLRCNYSLLGTHIESHCYYLRTHNNVLNNFYKTLQTNPYLLSSLSHLQQSNFLNDEICWRLSTQAYQISESQLTLLFLIQSIRKPKTSNKNGVSGGHDSVFSG